MGDHSHPHPYPDQGHGRDHDHERRHSVADLKGIIGRSYKAYKSLVNKWRLPKKNQDDRTFKDDGSDKTTNRKVKEEKSKKSETPSKRDKIKDNLKADDGVFSRHFSLLSRSLSRGSHTPTPGPTYLSKSSSRSTISPLKSSLLRTFSRKSRTEDEISLLKPEKQPKRSASFNRTFSFSRSTSRKDTSETEKPNLSRSTSQKGTSETEKPKLSRSTSRRSTTPLVFSQSIARRKPQPIEKTLECTLEELCFSAVKRIDYVKDVISEEGYGIPFPWIIVSQEDTLTINIKPGWTNGTKVTFEGRGDEKPGYLPADIVFSIQEQRHHLFKRTGNDLEIVVEIPLLKALTGCHIAVPLLGGEIMSIYVNDIIYPGYEKVIHGQGMPDAKGGNRGDLRITFRIKFPTSLTDEQRSEASSILEACS
ncbi:hypothetical protein V6N13_085665 [Hibiscus sabdariffa]|uniref:Chaperone DnaJ C-terminal domain-containing protein n=1 Tax=Hibiscus sabdariffa TaxID=183260 RepID=A0ABR2D296_9ROSI